MMMGYMGFGMQKWIYSRAPRKPFVVPKLKYCNELDSYERTFKIQPSKSSDNFYLLISLFLILITTIILHFTKDDFRQHSIYINQKKAEIENIEKQNAFNFLMKSGVYRLKRNHIKGAYSEFKLGLNIYPKNKEMNTLLIETLSIMCKNENEHCLELDEHLLKMNNLKH